MKRKTEDRLARLQQQETKFLQQEFLSPALKHKPVQVKVEGVVLTLKIVKPKVYEGFGVFKAKDHRTAEFVREATMAERRQYLSIFPSCRLIVCAKKDDKWFGLPANEADARFKIEGLVPISFPQNIQMLQTVETRFDGYQCWFAGAIRRPDVIKKAKALRDALTEFLEPEKISDVKMTREEEAAYNMALLQALEERQDTDEERIQKAIERAGGKYKSYIDRGDAFTIQYSVDGKDHASVVSKDNLEVRMAGICLHGEDDKFDLQSLIGVIREGIGRNRIVRGDYRRHYGRNVNDDYGNEVIGGGYVDDDYEY